MKRLPILLLLCALVFTGCGITQGNSRFYYPRAEYLFYDPEPVIAWENRDTAGHTQDLRYLLSQYLMGPLDQNLRSPLPRGTRMVSLEITGADVTVTVSEEADNLSDARFSLAAACLALTVQDCLGSSGQLTLICEDRSFAVTKESLMMYEEPFPEETESG